MKRNDEKTILIPTHDYAQARQKAVSWLGDRYLLAEPAPRRREQRPAYFGESQGWQRRIRTPTGTRH